MCDKVILLVECYAFRLSCVENYVKLACKFVAHTKQLVLPVW
jgi:hypothetical protein